MLKQSFLTRMGRHCLLCLALAAGLATSASGAVLTFDFETFPGADGRIGTADDQANPSCGPGPSAFCGGSGYAGPSLYGAFASAGLTFTRGVFLQGDFFPGTDTQNHYLSSSPVDIAFSRPFFAASIESYSYWSATMYALDASNQVIATDTITNETVSFQSGTLQVASDAPIARLVILPTGCPIGGERGFCDRILNLDNLVLRDAPADPGTPAAVPEPSTFVLAGLPLVLFQVARWQRTGRP